MRNLLFCGTINVVEGHKFFLIFQVSNTALDQIVSYGVTVFFMIENRKRRKERLT